MIALIGIGANLGDARENVLDALARLGRQSGCRMVAASSLWRTAPVDASGDDYINAVALIDTDLDAHVLLATLHAIEHAHGRERPYLNAPRTLDLDLLLYGEETIDMPALTVPHPRMHERAFVLAPLLEIAPETIIPGRGLAADFLASVTDQAVVRLDT
ncbi:2-amino-4-hydroxy-6-hydroxymethyldihydropteridine diphosphokinase [Massilia sp. Leaf139]|uniref:2-amino-4-hydroxy-6- hydroxymethyldihydropteridine diphosphokinase n=1 Tax=Massilia sp. Leaf139 TaxID=1736272 RepID=UPI0006F5FBFA|nr:2-amino-4-hydroxy-6-hydroxymethyldihydropteridine diphosphokinase [Massilia sp. Leaf139]KQQ87269.1 2-amino-4-hydroxy-6-hydroxymethyldihydropteridine pyrophosphokinase [Massilia sp. Leaf139]